MRQYLSSWATSPLEACLVTMENITDGNEKNKCAFVRVNGIDLLLSILSKEKIRDETELMISCYQLFLRCTSENADTVRKLLMTKHGTKKQSIWIRNIADTIVQKQNRDDDDAIAG